MEGKCSHLTKNGGDSFSGCELNFGHHTLLKVDPASLRPNAETKTLDVYKIRYFEHPVHSDISPDQRHEHLFTFLHNARQHASDLGLSNGVRLLVEERMAKIIAGFNFPSFNINPAESVQQKYAVCRVSKIEYSQDHGSVEEVVQADWLDIQGYCVL